MLRGSYRFTNLSICVLLALPACSDVEGGGDESLSASGGVFTSASTNADDGLSSTGDVTSMGDDASGSGAASNGDDDDGGPKLDVGGSAEGGSAEAGDEGCKAVDFLFLIDNSGSMGDNQQALVGSFQPFMDAIVNTVDAGSDYHIMVAKTDSGWFPETCGVFCNLSCPDLPDGVCSNPTPPSSCDETLGSGVTYPIGGNASNTQCDLVGGNRYILADEPDLGSAFSCIAQVGTDGNASETQMEALTAALADQNQGPGGCNEGFLRDDAILVVTVITDEPDEHSPGSPDGWYQNLLAAKANDPSAFVLLGLINDTDLADPVCPTASADPGNIRDFVTMFPNHIRGSVCNTEGYGEFFAQAVELIDTTCDDFIPPG
jgi:hypothetical protein